jgi:hypothetical protein
MVRGAPRANVNMTGNAPTFATLFLRVFLPFAFAYFLSYIFRGVNARAACRRFSWSWRQWARPCSA